MYEEVTIIASLPQFVIHAPNPLCRVIIILYCLMGIADLSVSAHSRRPSGATKVGEKSPKWSRSGYFWRTL